MVLTMVRFLLTRFRGKYIDFQLKMLYGKRVSVFERRVGPTCLSPSVHHRWPAYHGKETMVLTMVSFVLTRLRGKYIDFQLKMLNGKRVSVFERGGTCLSTSVSHGKRAYHGKTIMVLTMVSFVLTTFRGKYINFQLNMLYGKRLSVFGRVGAPPSPHMFLCFSFSW